MLSDKEKFKKISKKRINTAKVLIEAKDYEAAVFMLGLSLECALKSVICKTLKLDSYPQNTSEKKIDDFFMTHRFDRLRLVSGLSTLFSSNSPNIDAFQNWSEFTKEYSGEWTGMRYEDSTLTEEKVRSMYNNLTNKDNGIIATIKSKKLW